VSHGRQRYQRRPPMVGTRSAKPTSQGSGHASARRDLRRALT
jgi:hypothetical protein